MNIILDEGFAFGLGFFETVAVDNGEAIMLEEHLERLNHALTDFAIRPPVVLQEVVSWLEKQPETSHHALKIMVSAENLVMTLRPNPYDEEKRTAGFRMDFSNVIRNETSPLVSRKSLNYGDCILEKRRAASLGLDELIFVNSKVEICEGTCTNIFFGKNGRLYTPHTRCGLLPGIMRKEVLESRGGEETVVRKEDVEKYDSCFVTNSLMGVMPVRQLGKKVFARNSKESALFSMGK